jgi:hypothetical protein
VSALAHYLEEEGVPTVAISLIRLHTEKVGPPRALWVPFELGRPLGAPKDEKFQLRVITAALRLLEAAPGPVVLEDFPDDDPTAVDLPGWQPPFDLTAGEIDVGRVSAAVNMTSRLFTNRRSRFPQRGRFCVSFGNSDAGRQVSTPIPSATANPRFAFCSTTWAAIIGDRHWHQSRRIGFGSIDTWGAPSIATASRASWLTPRWRASSQRTSTTM